MPYSLPFLTSYDPPGTSEGTLDPLGLYPIADQLGVMLVPAVRERMQRVRFLTAMTVGAFVTEDFEGDSRYPDASPQLIWEWLVVEAMIRELGDDPDLRGVPGTIVVRRALDTTGYVDARSYLKTPRIFGFSGVYKRLAMHLGLVDVHLAPGPQAEGLVDAWARGLGFKGFSEVKLKLAQWTEAVRRCSRESPPRTKAGWSKASRGELARAFAPRQMRSREKRFIRELLHAEDDRALGALPTLWKLQTRFKSDESYREEALHDHLAKREPMYEPLVKAIRGYEMFARGLQDAFDLLKAEAARLDAHGFPVGEIARDTEFKTSVKALPRRFDSALHALQEVSSSSTSPANDFSQKFGQFSEPMDLGTCAIALCDHHEAVQRAKDAEGKRPWFDRIGRDRIYIRHAYREPRRDIQPDRYVHDYRGWPIRRFYLDLK